MGSSSKYVIHVTTDGTAQAEGIRPGSSKPKPRHADWGERVLVGRLCSEEAIKARPITLVSEDSINEPWTASP